MWHYYEIPLTIIIIIIIITIIIIIIIIITITTIYYLTVFLHGISTSVILPKN